MRLLITLSCLQYAISVGFFLFASKMLCSRQKNVFICVSLVHAHVHWIWSVTVNWELRILKVTWRPCEPLTVLIRILRGRASDTLMISNFKIDRALANLKRKPWNDNNSCVAYMNGRDFCTRPSEAPRDFDKFWEFPMRPSDTPTVLCQLMHCTCATIRQEKSPALALNVL